MVVRPVHYVLVCNSACGFILKMVKPDRLIAEYLACHSLFFFYHLHLPSKTYLSAQQMCLVMFSASQILKFM